MHSVATGLVISHDNNVYECKSDPFTVPAIETAILTTPPVT